MTRPITVSVPSATLGEPFAVRILVPGESAPLSTLYLLHGRGDSMLDWDPALEVLDELVGSGAIPPVVAVMPDAPWSSRAGYWVDSRHDAGRPIESAVVDDLVPWIDDEFGTAADRVVAGYSMGGYGAVRYLAAHPDVFSSTIALSPAVYDPLPPSGSSARESGAFGVGSALFDDTRYRSLNYPHVLAESPVPQKLIVAYGANEYRHPDAAEHDVDVESAALVEIAIAAGVDADVRGYPGGHDWGTWRAALADALLRLYCAE